MAGGALANQHVHTLCNAFVHFGNRAAFMVADNARAEVSTQIFARDVGRVTVDKLAELLRQ